MLPGLVTPATFLRRNTSYAIPHVRLLSLAKTVDEERQEVFVVHRVRLAVPAHGGTLRRFGWELERKLAAIAREAKVRSHRRAPNA